jgi:predicted RNA-binding protein YlqC (UPF0109 family)
MDLTERLRQLVEYNCRAIIDEGHEVAVAAVPGTENLLFEVRSEPADVGLIIGKQGRIIEGIRALVRGACRGAAVRTQVEVCNSRI